MTMRIDDILSKFEGEGQRSYITFETFVLNLLKYHIENQEKTFIPLENLRGFGDALAENGFDNINSSTLIEIKINLHRFHPRVLIDQLAFTMTQGGYKVEFQNLWIINYRTVPPRTAERLIREYMG